MTPFSPLEIIRDIQATRTTDALLIMYVLSCKTSLYWEYTCNMEHKWTKRIIINNDGNVHSHGRVWMNWFRTSLHTSTQPLQSFPIFCILTTAFINTYLDDLIKAEVGKQLWCSLKEKSRTLIQYILSKTICFWVASIYLRASSDNTTILNTKMRSNLMSSLTLTLNHFISYYVACKGTTEVWKGRWYKGTLHSDNPYIWKCLHVHFVFPTGQVTVDL